MRCCVRAPDPEVERKLIIGNLYVRAINPAKMKEIITFEDCDLDRYIMTLQS